VLVVTFNAVARTDIRDSVSCEAIARARAIAARVESARDLIVRLVSCKGADFIYDSNGRADKFEIGSGPWQLEQSGCPAFPTNVHVDQFLVPRQRHIVDQKPQHALAITH
jgi:hypothetical protein